ncbi:MAG: outer membrane protein assembly factor BamD [Paludibacteraceae bacterium]|nr:outer membrane protein assembly factor BamD [Paludibacteraceae bacterium]
MKEKGFILMLVLVLATSCGEYQKLLKSADPELKYEKAIEYFNQKKYSKALTLFDDISTYYKGTERSEDVLNYLSRCYYGQKDYTSAAEYYQIYIRNYPKGRYITEARFMLGHCYYLDSPDARLDQAVTRNAITHLTEFVELYPESEYAAQAYEEIDAMNNKLAQKEYYSAKLYYNLGTYLGNNYESCAIVSRNALKNYPGNKYREEFSWLILQSKYQQLVNSVSERRQERAQDTEDECYNFITEFPQSKHKKAAEKIRDELRKMMKD